MRSDLTDITMILDASSSMSSCKDETIIGVNSLIQEQRKEDGECRFTLIEFNHAVRPIYRCVSIQTIPLLNSETYRTMGNTALLDAVGSTIANTGVRLSTMPERDRPGKVLTIIVTDGEENASRNYTKEQVIYDVNHQRDVYSWEFVFMGADIDAVATAASVGIYNNQLNYGKQMSSEIIGGKLHRAIAKYRKDDAQVTCNFFDA